MTSTSRILFVVAGALWLAIGALAPFMLGRGVGPTMVFVSPRTDAELFGSPSEEILASNADLATLRLMLLRTLAGFLTGSGILVLALALFGLGGDTRWALIALSVVGVAVLPFWWSALNPYRAAGIRLTIGDLPPFMWVPAILMPVASVLGWLGSN